MEDSECLDCKKIKKMYCKNLCKSCYNKKHRDNEKHKKNLKKWRENNPDYFKNYNRGKKDE